jgi:NAD(P)H-flavin reductase
MSSSQGRILELFNTGAGIAALAALERPIISQPGQYLRVRTSIESAVLPVTAFPLDSGGELLRILPVSDQNWIVGQEVTLHGPMGRGFILPASARRVGLLATKEARIDTLLLFAEKALADGHEVALVTDALLTDLPTALEVLPTAQIKEVASWADYVAAVTSRTGIPGLVKNMDELRKPINQKLPDEVLVLSEMPCAGAAACGVCAVLTKTGWKHACKEGPVFSMAELVSE